MGQFQDVISRHPPLHKYCHVRGHNCTGAIALRRVRLYILAGAVIDCVLAAGWERFLQHVFPAPMPPRKGYMKFLKPEQLKTESARLKSD